MIYSQKMSMGLLNKSVHNFQTENRGDMPSRIIMNDEDFEVMCDFILENYGVPLNSKLSGCCYFMGIRVVRSKDLKRSEALFVK